MIDHLLTDEELELLIEVLDAEHKRLLPEVRHTDSRVLRRQLVGVGGRRSESSSGSRRVRLRRNTPIA